MASLFNWLRGSDRTPRRPAAAARHLREGNALLAAGRLDAAARQYEEALAADAESADACVNLGFVLHTLGRPEAARPYLERAVRLNPGSADAHYLSGLVAEALGDLEGACQHLAAAVANKPDFVFAWRDLCRLNFRTGRIAEAKRAAKQGLVCDAQSADLHHYLGNIYLGEQDYSRADACYERALSIMPDFAEAASNRGLALHELGRDDEALASFDRAIAAKPDFAEAHNNRGNLLLGLARPEEALACYDRAVTLKPDYADAYNNRGFVLHALGRFDAALQSYRRAIALKPDFADAHWNAALTLLLLGDFEQGWREYEWRWLRSEVKGSAPVFDRPLWLGSEDLSHRTILLHAEQGLGDTIQFCRYVEKVAALGARVILETQPPLLPLLKGLPGAAVLVGRGEDLPAFDCHCPLLSLPLALRIGDEEISGRPYLRALPEKVAAWQIRLGRRRAPRIGVVWSGSSGHKNDRNRSIPLHEFREVLAAGCDYFCLQKEIREADRTILGSLEIETFAEELADFTDTAALIEVLDLVITVDTSVAHLAGALGKTVWILLPHVPDWRWLLDREDSPWYDSARLFRQTSPGDWAQVLRRVRHATDERFGGQ